MIPEAGGAAMRRREFITLIGGAAAWPLGAWGQQPGRVYRRGISLPAARDEPAILAFFDQLRIEGFVEGSNLEVLPGGFRVRNDQIEQLVPTIIRMTPDVIVTGGDLAIRAFQKATQSIPMVVMTEHDCGRVRCVAGSTWRQYHRQEPD